MPNTTVHWRLDVDVSRDEAARLLDRFAAFLNEYRPDVIVCDVAAIDEASLGTVNALARMSLLAKRHRARLDLVGIRPQLWMLLRFSGMDSVLRLGP